MSSHSWLQDAKLLGQVPGKEFDPKTGIAEYDMDWEDLKTHLPYITYIKLAGGEPANFLDVGGGATPEKIVKAFKLISMDEKVKVILVNIFAGINRCDWVAEGIVQALQKIEIKVPLVIRLAGTNVEKGNEILKNSKIKYIEASTLEDAANKAVKALN